MNNTEKLLRAFIDAAGCEVSMKGTTQYWNTRTCAKSFDCSEYTIRHSRNNGTLFGCPSPEFIKIGNAVFYDKDTVEAWKAKYSKVFKTTKDSDSEDGDAL